MGGREPVQFKGFTSYINSSKITFSEITAQLRKNAVQTFAVV